MAEEKERDGRPPSGAAVWSALGASSAAKADAFLDEQIILTKEQAALTRLQAEDLRREDRLRHWSLRVHHVSDVLKLAFELALAAIFTTVVLIIAGAVWSAAHEDGLVIEAFSVPPDLAAQGLTGQAVAAKLQDKLSAMQAATGSARPAESYSNNWGNDIKVEIPDTGVSIGEVYRYLVDRFGHQTHITGEIYRTKDGVAITARSGGDPGTTVSGAEADIDALMQQAAEKIYERTQPYRYAVYAVEMQSANGGREKSRAILEGLVESGPLNERVWGHAGLATLADTVDPRLAMTEEQKSLALDPSFVLAWNNIANDDAVFGHDEKAVADLKATIALLETGKGEINERASRILLPYDKATLEDVLDDFGASLHDGEVVQALPDFYTSVEGMRQQSIVTLAQLHRTGEMRRAWRDLPPVNGEGIVGGQLGTIAGRLGAKLVADYWSGDWSAVVAEYPATERTIRQFTTIPGYSTLYEDITLKGQVWPYAARALAETGDLKGAHALIDRTPLDCYGCLRNRADIAAAEKNWAAADTWFARAVAAGPSIPMAYYDWGRVLLMKGDTAGAIAKFQLAADKGPHFADPLELWGEALMAQNRSDLAAAKFADAEKYAPNWGRLHLKWGEALWWSGKKDEARKQFAVAAALDLTPSEKSELAKVSHGG
jgi:tetratricopeptide (TPR) repeat protein